MAAGSITNPVMVPISPPSTSPCAPPIAATSAALNNHGSFVFFVSFTGSCNADFSIGCKLKDSNRPPNSSYTTINLFWQYFGYISSVDNFNFFQEDFFSSNTMTIHKLPLRILIFLIQPLLKKKMKTATSKLPSSKKTKEVPASRP